jgi:hypothetical protein
MIDTFTRGIAAMLLAVPLLAQTPQGEAKLAKEKKPYSPPKLFASAAPVRFTLWAPFGLLKKDRWDKMPYHPASVTYAGDSGEVKVPVHVRARGIWRRKNCEIPPLRLNFKKDSAKKTLFSHLDRVRLVLPCKGGDDFEQYILQEYQLYRVQRLLTPYSYDVRLARVSYVDSEKKDTLRTGYAFLLEESIALAERLGGKVEDIKGAAGDDLQPDENAMFGVFEYMIGNTDFSVAALHNVTLLFKDSVYVPVAYDFDWSGAVNTRYAKPAPQLNIRTVENRIMRGYCSAPEHFEKAFTVFREKKDAIYALYSDSLAAPLKPDVVKRTLKFFDDFYEVINNPRLAKRMIVESCLGGVA